MEVFRISAVTLLITDMKRSCSFYSRLPGFVLVYGGGPNDRFTTFKIGGIKPSTYLNLELVASKSSGTSYLKSAKHVTRIIFYTDDVDKLYLHMQKSKTIPKLIYFESDPVDAKWGERYFHVLDPDGYQLSFATPLTKASDFH
jgi:catechol 2,3-dioxygenase-like lactoylglutathione lyase family enzyme